MMMHALATGGLNVCHPPRESQTTDGYRWNPLEYCDGCCWKKIGVLDGLLIRAIQGNLYFLRPKHDHTIIFMTRNPEEVDASRRLTYKAGVTAELYNEANRYWLSYIRDRLRNIRLLVVQYEEVVQHPQDVFHSLDLPIDADKAASTVDPAWHRNRHG